MAECIDLVERDAHRVMDVLPKRFERYGLNLHPTKTRLVRFQKPNDRNQSSGTPESFDLLGFTHYWGRSLRGNWVVKRKTSDIVFGDFATGDSESESLGFINRIIHLDVIHGQKGDGGMRARTFVAIGKCVILGDVEEVRRRHHRHVCLLIVPSVLHTPLHPRLLARNYRLSILVMGLAVPGCWMPNEAAKYRLFDVADRPATGGNHAPPA